MKVSQPSEREFVEGLNRTEQEFKPQGFAKYEAGMRQYLLAVEGRTKRAAIKLEMRRRVLERIFSFACVSGLGGHTVVELLKELEEVGFERLDKRVAMAGLLGVWLTCARDSDQAAIGPSDRFLAATAALLKKRRASQLRSECEEAVAGSSASLPRVDGSHEAAMKTASIDVLNRVSGLVGVADVVWAPRPADWIPTKHWLSLLVRWARIQLGVEGGLSSAELAPFSSMPNPERFAADVLSWRCVAPLSDDWPAAILSQYNALDRIERYRIMRIFEHSRILEPTRVIGALAAFAEDVSSPFASTQDQRDNWPPADDASRLRSVEEAVADRAQRTRAHNLIAAADRGLHAIEPDIEQLLRDWHTASKGAPGRGIAWSLGHQRVVDAVVFATVRAARTKAR